MVRPLSPTSATVSDINASVNNRRRVFYPSQLPNENKRYLSYILNDVTNGFSSTYPQNTTFQLRFLDLDNPENDYLIEEQPSEYPQIIAMDVIVPRWIKGSTYLTYGSKDVYGKAQGKMRGKLMDVHGAGAQRSDPKSGNKENYPQYFGPQGDVRYVYNYVRCVRDISKVENTETTKQSVQKTKQAKQNQQKNNSQNLKTTAPSFEKMLTNMDTNNDGKISKLEARGKLKENFDKRDKNKDGYITQDELTRRKR